MNETPRKHDPLLQLMRKADKEPDSDLKKLSQRLQVTRANRARRTIWLTASVVCCLIVAVTFGVTRNSSDSVAPKTQIAESEPLNDQHSREFEVSEVSEVDFDRQLAQLRFEQQQLDLVEIRIKASELARQADASVMRNALLAKASREIVVPDLTELGF